MLYFRVRRCYSTYTSRLWSFLFFLLLFLTNLFFIDAKAIDLFDATQLEPYEVNFCNDSSLLDESGLIRAPLGQFLGYPCSAEFFHCRWQSDGFRTYRKTCRTGLVYDTQGTQNCNYDYNVKGCAMRADGETCKPEEFSCPLSESCVTMGQRCDGNYDCVLEEDEQNCPMCTADEFPCIVSEQCISMKKRCNGLQECRDGTDELDCETCAAGSFYCLKSEQCIPMEQRCDGIPQCIKGEDELLCKSTQEKLYVCENRMEQVPLTQVCDGQENCYDGSDEKYCNSPASSGMSFSSLNKNIEVKEPEKVVTPAVELEYELVSVEPVVKSVIASFPMLKSLEFKSSDEMYEEGDSDDLPASPLMPIARFSPTTKRITTRRTTLPPTTVTMTKRTSVATTKKHTTRRPSYTKMTRASKSTLRPTSTEPKSTEAISQSHKSTEKPFRPPKHPHRNNKHNTITITTTKSPSHIKIRTTTPPKEPGMIPEYQGHSGTKKFFGPARIYQVTNPPLKPLRTTMTSKSIEISAAHGLSDPLEEEILRKLSARLGNNSKYSAKELLKRIESMLSDESHVQTRRESSEKAYANAFVDYISEGKTLHVTGKPSRKWKPSLSHNPSHKTTPLPHAGEMIPVQFRHSDAIGSSAYAQAVQIAQQLKSSRHRYPARISTSTTTTTPEPGVTKQESIYNQTKQGSTISSDEAYFTYDDEDRVTKPRDLI